MHATIELTPLSNCRNGHLKVVCISDGKWRNGLVREYSKWYCQNYINVSGQMSVVIDNSIRCTTEMAKECRRLWMNNCYCCHQSIAIQSKKCICSPTIQMHAVARYHKPCKPLKVDHKILDTKHLSNWQEIIQSVRHSLHGFDAIHFLQMISLVDAFEALFSMRRESH